MSKEPEYFYSYLNPKVKCEHCGESFRFRDMEDYVIEDEYYSDICPKCGETNCCEYELESLESALRRKK
jgi:Zn finger protein HypA/HybF involved in hydrogenase expression